MFTLIKWFGNVTFTHYFSLCISCLPLCLQSEAIGEELKYALEDIDAEKPLDVLSEDDIANMQGDCLALLW